MDKNQKLVNAYKAKDYKQKRENHTYIVIWKEGRNLERTRRLGFDNPSEVKAFTDKLISENKPFRSYSLFNKFNGSL